MDLWKDLLSLSQHIQLPWVVMRYMNVILNADEKRVEDGDTQGSPSELKDFLEQAETGRFEVLWT